MVWDVKFEQKQWTWTCLSDRLRVDSMLQTIIPRIQCSSIRAQRSLPVLCLSWWVFRLDSLLLGIDVLWPLLLFLTLQIKLFTSSFFLILHIIYTQRNLILQNIHNLSFLFNIVILYLIKIFYWKCFACSNVIIMLLPHLYYFVYIVTKCEQYYRSALSINRKCLLLHCLYHRILLSNFNLLNATIMHRYYKQWHHDFL